MKILLLAHSRSGSSSLAKALSDVLNLKLILEPFNKRLWEEHYKKEPPYIDGPIPENTIFKHITMPNTLSNLQGRLKEFDRVIFLIRNNIKDVVISEVNSQKYGYNTKYKDTEDIEINDIEKVIKMYKELINPVRFNIFKSNLIWYDDLYNDYYKSIQTIKKLKLDINESQFNKMWDEYLNPSYRLRQENSNIRKIYSSEDCKTDRDGGPYYFDMNEIGKIIKEQK